jgi:hypothetical protein
MPALAGAFLVGVVGAKWITNEADKRLRRESMKIAGIRTKMSAEKAEAIASGASIAVLKKVKKA